ncbi:hypothetical protein [Candidatus Igneacidithiobacillus taiwanensis]|uniref:hypothetical protein n=1 Tax=Candidatus Igneacidithiobacillus taiwanensis TaxID=1945924 RepID=UPI00289654FC|nr:hypothetical protein [Candidatus Igneacidithiobacillus taiwanensis]
MTNSTVHAASDHSCEPLTVNTIIGPTGKRNSRELFGQLMKSGEVVFIFDAWRDHLDEESLESMRNGFGKPLNDAT